MFGKQTFRFGLALAVLAVFAGAPRAREVLAGPVTAAVIAVVDGDTLDVRVRVWLGQDLVTRVRIDGVDSPELRGRCAEERHRAEAARDFLAARLGPGNAVVLRDVRYGKYAGRVLARVETTAGEDLAGTLIAAGLARPYDGGRRGEWCRAVSG